MEGRGGDGNDRVSVQIDELVTRGEAVRAEGMRR